MDGVHRASIDQHQHFFSSSAHRQNKGHVFDSFFLLLFLPLLHTYPRQAPSHSSAHQLRISLSVPFLFFPIIFVWVEKHYKRGEGVPSSFAFVYI